MSKKKNPGEFQPGESGNPDGRPPAGMSWAEIIDSVVDRTAGEIASSLPAGDLQRAFKQFPRDKSMRELIIMRVLCSVMFEPSAALLTGLMSRSDGSPPQSLEIKKDWRAWLTENGEDPEAVLTELTEFFREREGKQSEGENT